MPCYDPRDNLPGPLLCAIMRTLDNLGLADQVRAAIDWKQAGVTPDDLQTWWDMHRASDERKARIAKR